MEVMTTELKDFKMIKLSGRIDWDAARRLDKHIQELIDRGCRRIVFNLDDVLFICSGGVGALMYNLNKMRRLGGNMYLISSNEYVNYIFETLKFNVVFEGVLYQDFEKFHEDVIQKVVP